MLPQCGFVPSQALSQGRWLQGHLQRFRGSRATTDEALGFRPGRPGLGAADPGHTARSLSVPLGPRSSPSLSREETALLCGWRTRPCARS